MNVDITDRDVWAIERLSEAAMRAGHTREAIGGFALALRLRAALGMHTHSEPEEEVRENAAP